MRDNAEVLAKFASGYPGLALTDANVLAYLEAFAFTDEDVFERGLKEAAKTSPAFFPTIPQVWKAIDDRRAEAYLGNSAALLPAPSPPVRTIDEPKREPGWLYKMFLEKCEERKKKKLEAI